MDALFAAVQSILSGESTRITIRHLFYRLVAMVVIEKTDAAYKVMGSHLAKWRKAQFIPWGAFSDNTRWRIGGDTHDDAGEALLNTVSVYRKNLWTDQRVYMEIWSEKDAIAGIPAETADNFGVKVFVCRGYASLTSLFDAAELFKSKELYGKQVRIAYFGDHDPSGVVIDRSFRENFRNHFDIDVAVDRVAVTPEQIRELNLPTRPVKSGDSRAKHWSGGCVEIDAIPAQTLQQLVESAIVSHIDQGAWSMLRKVEEAEKQSLREIYHAFRREAA